MCADGSLFEGMTRVLVEVKAERDRLRAEVWRLTQRVAELEAKP